MFAAVGKFLERRHVGEYFVCRRKPALHFDSQENVFAEEDTDKGTESVFYKFWTHNFRSALHFSTAARDFWFQIFSNKPVWCCCTENQGHTNSLRMRQVFPIHLQLCTRQQRPLLVQRRTHKFVVHLNHLGARDVRAFCVRALQRDTFHFANYITV